MPGGWSWKEKNGETGGLLYAPGNWGDVLKGTWLLATVRHLLSIFDLDHFAYLDLFAGAPDYPLGAKNAKNLRFLSGTYLVEISRPWTDRRRWPSAASLVAAEVEEKIPIFVSEGEPSRRAAWEHHSCFILLPEAECGWKACERVAKLPASLVLIDPYDFLSEWKERLDTVLAVAEVATVLLYSYNRAIRSPEKLREALDFIHAVEAGWGNRPKLWGRVPSDGFIPVAHHEMLLLPGPVLQKEEGLQLLLEELADLTYDLNARIRRSGEIEY